MWCARRKLTMLLFCFLPRSQHAKQGEMKGGVYFIKGWSLSLNYFQELG